MHSVQQWNNLLGTLTAFLLLICGTYGIYRHLSEVEQLLEIWIIGTVKQFNVKHLQ